MRRLLLAWVFFSLVVAAFAQQPPPAKQDPAALAALNRDIWEPFRAAYAAGEPEKYLALHLPDFIRGEGSRKVVRTLEEYSNGVRRSFESWKKRGQKIEIEFRFTERIARGDLASERGIYQFTSTAADGSVQKFHGQFHTFSRRVNGQWRFAVDYDSNEGGTINQSHFDAAAAADDFSRF